MQIKLKWREIITKTKEHTYINTHTHTHTNKTKTVQIKKVQECNWAKKTTNDIDQLKTKLKHKLENKTKAECQRGNKGRKTKQTNRGYWRMFNDIENIMLNRENRE